MQISRLGNGKFNRRRLERELSRATVHIPIKLKRNFVAGIIRRDERDGSCSEKVIRGSNIYFEEAVKSLRQEKSIFPWAKRDWIEKNGVGRP